MQVFMIYYFIIYCNESGVETDEFRDPHELHEADELHDQHEVHAPHEVQSN